MTRYCALTTCNQEQWKRFGRAMVNTFARHWPEGVLLEVYCESFWPEPLDVPTRQPGPWIGYTLLEDAAPWHVEWKASHRDPKYNGGPGGRNYRYDAVRFSHKVAALGAAADICDCDVLIWLDADIVTHAPVTTEWLDGLFPKPAVVAWLDRANKIYPECGFLMFRMPETRALIAKIVKAYQNDAIFKMQEWHDSYVIQQVVEQSGVLVHSLSGQEGRKTNHPLVNSLLGTRMDHLKGEKRKVAGRSFQSDLHRPRSEPYWKSI